MEDAAVVEDAPVVEDVPVIVEGEDKAHFSEDARPDY